MTPEQKAHEAASGNKDKIEDTCPFCGKTDAKWDSVLRRGSEFDLEKLKPNQRGGYGTGKNDHMLYTHRCEQPPASGERTRKVRADAGKPRESLYVNIPGIRFDLGIIDGKAAFVGWLGTQVQADSDVALAVGELLIIIDRLRSRAK